MLTRANYVAIGLVICCAGNLRAQMHPAEPSVNLGDTSFLDAVGGPGLLVEEIADGYRSNTAKNGSGSDMPGRSDSKSISGLTHIVWVSNHRFLGAWAGAEVVFIPALVDARARGSASGFADLTVSPLVLQWNEWHAGPFRLQQRVVVDSELPVGQYRQTFAVNLSAHAFTVHPYYAVTCFPTKHIETSWRVHYLWNSKNHSPAAGAGSTQAGQAIHFNATLGCKLPRGFWVGANGYYLKQVTDPRFNGQDLTNSPEQVGSIGPGAVWDRGRYVFFANYYHEVAVVNRPKGDKLVLRMEWIRKSK